METKPLKIFLLPPFFKWVGAAFIVIGLIAGYLYYYGGRPDVFETKMFAVYSFYLSGKSFELIKTNLLDEIFAVASLTGFWFVAFSKLANETDKTLRIRIESLFLSIHVVSALLAILFLVIYGWPVIVVAALMFYVFFVVYISIFYIKLKLSYKKEMH